MSPHPNLTLAQYLSPPGIDSGAGVGAWGVGAWGVGLRWEHRGWGWGGSMGVGLGWEHGGGAGVGAWG